MADVASDLEIDFRPVAEADYPMLFAWRSQPHVREFYQKSEPSLEGVAAKYAPLVRGETHETTNHAALACSKAVGFAPIGAFVGDGCDMILLRIERGS